MRILHTSDWHLGIMINNTSMLPEQEHFIEQLIDIVRNEQIDAVVVAGDVFDSSVSNSDAIALYNKAVTAVCGVLKTPMLIIAGNHDGAARLSSCRELLKNSGLYITGKLTKNMRPTILDDVHFYSIPHFNIDEVRCLYPELEIKSYESAFQTVCDNIRLNMDNSKVNIVIAHAFISGAELSDSDKSAMIGTANMVSKDVFDGFSYVALGHLHRPQKVDNHIVYSGSPLKYSFGEVTRDKSVMILDTADMTKTKVEIKPINNMRSIKGTYDDVSGDAICSNDYIKIEITDRYIGLEALDFFRSYYPNLLAISGKAASLDNEQMTLSIDDVENLTPLEILNRFFLETLQCEPEKEQIELFNAALTAIDDGGDLS